MLRVVPRFSARPRARMDRPAAPSSLFRFAAPPAAPAVPAAPAAPAEPGEDRPTVDRTTAAWRGPVLICGATVAATAGLAFAVLVLEGYAPRPAAAVTAVPDAAVLPAAAEETEGPAEAVVPALHVWDGRPVRAVPTDTVPDPLRDFGVTPARLVVPAAATTPTAGRGRVAPAVWLTGEIVP